MIDLTQDTFEFFVPAELRKSDSPADDKVSKRWIQGIASTDSVDLQNEVVVQAGIDLSYFLKYGYINDDHKPGPEHKVGEPTEARITKAGLWIKAFLYKGDGTERCDYWWQHVERLERSDAERKVGFSIQGKVLRRDGNKILKCWLQDIAITASPVNTDTWAEVVKSLAAEKWCIHPWKSLEKACKGCPGQKSCKPVPASALTRGEDEEKALSTSGMGGVMRVQSLEGRSATLAHAGAATSKSLSMPDDISYPEAVAYIATNLGLGHPAAVVVADAIFAQSSLH